MESPVTSRQSGIPRASGIPRLSRLPIKKQAPPNVVPRKEAVPVPTPGSPGPTHSPLSQNIARPRLSDNGQSPFDPTSDTHLNNVVTSFDKSPPRDTQQPLPDKQYLTSESRTSSTYGLATEPVQATLSDRTIKSIAKVPRSVRRRRSSFFSSENAAVTPSRTCSNEEKFRTPSGKQIGGPRTNASSARAKVYETSLKSPRQSSLTKKEFSTPIWQASRPQKLRNESPENGRSSIIRSTPQRSNDIFANTVPSSERSTKHLLRRAERNKFAVSSRLEHNDTSTPSPARQDAVTAERKTTKSSAALRAQILKAKAAQKSKIDKKFSECDDFDDPFNQHPKSTESGLVRITERARTSGRLDISAMNLAAIPDQVIDMYRYDSNTTASIPWNETVDLTHFVAADNNIESISDVMFPDISLESLALSDDDNAPVPEFNGITHFDMHGNELRCLPKGMCRLTELSILNLSRNGLDNSVFEVISEMGNLRELRLAANNITEIQDSIKKLKSLQNLDLRENGIRALPDSMLEVDSLRHLDVSGNHITILAENLFVGLPLVSLKASRNTLTGTLLPHVMMRQNTLQILDVSCNSLQLLTDGDELNLPALHTLNISSNKISKLPALGGCKNLIELLAPENTIAAIPRQFAELDLLKIADFTGNDITNIEAEIGGMCNLESFRISANPLRERKLLSMTTEDVKKHLMRKLETV